MSAAGAPRSANQDRHWATFLGSSGGVLLMVALAKVFGFGEKLGLAYFAGASASVDAYFTAVNVAFLLYAMVEDVVAPVFLARYVRIAEEAGPAEGRPFFMRTFCTTGLILLTSVALAELAPKVILHLVAPGFEGRRLAEATALLRITLPGGVFLALTSLTSVTLNAHRRFVLPAFAGVVYKAAIVLGILVMLPSLGIIGAGLSMLTAAAIQLAVHLWGLRRTGETPPSPSLTAANQVREPGRAGGATQGTLRLMAPLFAGAIAAQVSALVDNAWGSTLPPGSLAALGYARRLLDLPILLVPGVIGIVAFPTLARLAAQRQTRDMLSFLSRLMELCAIIFIPITLLFTLDAPTIVGTVFGRGAFDEAAVAKTSAALFFFSLGLVAYAWEILVLRAFYATLDTKTPTLIGLIFVTLHVVMTVTLTPALGLIAIPLALCTQKILKVSCLVAILARRHAGAWVDELRRRLARIGLSSGVFALAALVIGRILPARTARGASLHGLLVLGAIGLFSTALYAAALRATGVMTPEHLRNALKTLRSLRRPRP